MAGNGELKDYIRFFYFDNVSIFSAIESDFSLLNGSINSLYPSFEQYCALALMCS